jgi:hypothetical protein
MWKVNGK